MTGDRHSLPASPRRIRALRRALALLLLALLLQSLHACAMRGRILREVRERPRDPVTRVVIGCEALTLQPRPADRPSTRGACLLVHGFLSARSDFADLGQRLADAGYTVRLMRLPGHGSIPPHFAWLEQGALLEAVRAEYHALRQSHDRVYLLGFSMGGALSTLAAAEHNPDALILFAPYYGVSYRWYYLLPPETWNRLLGWAIPYLPRSEAFVKLNKKENRDKFFFYNTVPTRGVSQLVALGQDARRPSTLRRIHCPVLVFHSPQDGAASPRRSRRAFEQMASGDKHWVDAERSDHVLLWDYDAETIKGRTLDFLNRR